MVSLNIADVRDLIDVAAGRPVARFRAGDPVAASEDLSRVRALPRRVLDVRDPLAAELWTKHLRRERSTPCDCVARWGFCITDLRPVQGWALEEASDAHGLVASIGVGDGKTGIDILLAMAIPGVRSALLLIPPNLRSQLLLRDLPQWSAHFKVPNLAGGSGFIAGRPMLHVITYNELSNVKNSDLLGRLAIDLIIADEAHNLRDPGAARTIRFLRAFAKAPNIKFAALSGTLTTRSLKDYAHLSALALRERSPLPIHPPTVDEWSAALDATSPARPYLKAPGKLLALADEVEEPEHADETERARAGFQRRFADTPGVVVTLENTLRASLVIEARTVKLPREFDNAQRGDLLPSFVQYVEETIANNRSPSIIHAAIGYVSDTGERPDGEELIEAIEIARCVRQLASGFFYRWTFPRGESVTQIELWRARRKAWRKEIREELQNPRENYDSPGNITRAAIRWFEGYHYTDPSGARTFYPPGTARGPLPTLAARHWLAWKEVHKTVEPRTEAVWLSDFLARDAIEWASEQPGIVWVEHDEFMTRAKRLAREAKINLGFFGGGKEASATIIQERGDRSIFASIKAHGEGKNLQHAFSRNLITQFPANGKTAEQLLGRTHREGQNADEVIAAVYRYHGTLIEDFNRATIDARYIEQTTGTRQKLNYAGIEWA